MTGRRSHPNSWPSACVLALTALLAYGTPVGSLAFGAETSWMPQEGRELLGRPAPDWLNVIWMQGGPLSIRDLRGKVVLLRFLLYSCPYCKRTAPTLIELSTRYETRGLVVVGLHQSWSDESVGAADIARFATKLGFTFPIGLDTTGATLAAYGHGTIFQKFSSMSFLIDRGGIIRFVHEGGEFHPGGDEEHRRCNEAYEALIVAIDAALSNGPD